MSNNKAIPYADLLITLTSAFTPRWSDNGSGAARDGFFWHPVPQYAGTFRAAGSVAAPHHADLNNNFAAVLLADNPATRKQGATGPAVAPPVDYVKVWDDEGSGAASDGSFWRPVAPRGYIALGDVAVGGRGKPSLEEVWCVRVDLVSDGVYAPGSVWDDIGSGAARDASFWEVQPKPGTGAGEFIPVLAGTFRAVGGYDKPDGSLAKVPALWVPRSKGGVPSRPPVLEEADMPEVGDTFGEVPASSVTLPFTSFFSPGDRQALDGISDPFCTVTKNVSWVVLEKYPNYRATPYVQKQSLTTGIKKKKEETVEHSAGVTISSEVGYGLSKWSVSLNYQFSFSQTSSIEEVQERTISKTITVAPHTVAIAWGKRVVILGIRSDGSRIEAEVMFNASEEVAVTDIAVKETAVPPPK